MTKRIMADLKRRSFNRPCSGAKVDRGEWGQIYSPDGIIEAVHFTDDTARVYFIHHGVIYDWQINSPITDRGLIRMALKLVSEVCHD